MQSHDSTFNEGVLENAENPDHHVISYANRVICTGQSRIRLTTGGAFT